MNQISSALSGGPSNRVEPVTSADSFFGRPELNGSGVYVHNPTRCFSGCLALRVPDPPSYAPPTICAISKDGRIAAVGGKDVELYLWDTETGDMLNKLRGHEICWTGSNDNSFFITVQEDGKVNIWDMDQYRCTGTLGQVDEGIGCCSIALDDRYVVCGGVKGTVFSWDTGSGAEFRRYEYGHEGPVQTVMCYPMTDGTHVIISCGASDHTICVWDLESGAKRASILITELEHAKNIRYFISKDGTQVAVWCTDSVPFPNLVYVDAMNQTRTSVYCHDGLVRQATFSKDSQQIISCGSDGKIIVWDAQSLEAVNTMQGHVGNVMCCAINEEGTRIVSAGEDCTLKIWNAETGQLMMKMVAQDEPIKSCQFSKSGKKILTCDIAGRVYVWSLTAEFMLNLLRRYADSMSSCALTYDQKLCIVGCNNGRVMMWDVDARESVWEYSHHTGRVESVCFNTMRDLVATAGADGRISVLQVDSGKQANCFVGQDEPIMSVGFSPDDERLAGVTADGKLLLFQVSGTGRKAKLVLHNNIARVISFVWSPNSKLICGCCSDGCVLVWSAATGSIYTVLEGSNAATCCAFDLVGKLLAVGTVLGSVVLYNLETAELLTELRGNASPVREIIFNKETTRVTSLCSRQAVIWDMATTLKIRTFDFVVDKNGDFNDPPHPFRSTVAHDGTVLFDYESEAVVYDMIPIEDPLLRSYYLSDSRAILAGPSHRCIMMWSAAGNAAPDKFHTTHDAITSTHFSHDDRLIVMGTQDGNIVVYDVVHNETVEVLAAHQNGPCRCVRLSHDNQEILSCGADAKVILWDWKHRAASRIYTGHFISIGCCDLASQGNRVVSGDNHGMICVWEKDSGASVQTLPLAHSKNVLSLSMSADGSTIASVGADGKVSIWNVDAGIELVSLSAAIESDPLYCMFSPDGNKLAVTESNGNVLVWNAIAGCQWYMIFQAHKGKVTSCSWSADCRRFVTCGVDSTLGIWDAESGAPIFKFNIKSGALTTCTVSPLGIYVAAGSSTGTLSVCNIPMAQRGIPEPSFLYHWLATREPKQAKYLYRKLASQHNYLHNVQDATGWSLVLHAVNRGNADVTALVLEAIPPDVANLGLISAVPFTIQTRVKIHTQDGYGYEGEGYEPSGHSMAQPSVADMVNSGRKKSMTAMARRGRSFVGGSFGVAESTEPQPLALPYGGYRRSGHDGAGLSHSSRPTIEITSTGAGPLPPTRSGARHRAELPGTPKGLDPSSGGASWASGGSQPGTKPGAATRVPWAAGRTAGPGPVAESGPGRRDPEVDSRDNSTTSQVVGVQKSVKSFSQTLKKVAVELFTEKADQDYQALVQNNCLALALNSKSSECVQVILDAAAANKCALGSYHAVTDMMPSLAVRYPMMCHHFLASLSLRDLGDLEVPVSVIQDLNRSVIRTAPIFTNVKNLWQTHLKTHEVKTGPQPYAHVKASVVRLPYACSIGKDSLLQTLVESSVPVRVYGTPTIRAVIKHKWRLYARQKLLNRAIIYCFYALVFTVNVVLYSREDHDLNLKELWSNSAEGKVQLIFDGYLFAQAAWYAWTEMSQIYAIGIRLYFRSGWNALDAISIVMMLVICPMHVVRVQVQSGQALAPMMSFEVVMVWFKILFYALAFEPTGPFVNMVFQIAYAVRSFAVLLFMSCVSFGVALMALYQYAPPRDQNNAFSVSRWNDFGRALLTMWSAVLGQFDFTTAFRSDWSQLCIIFFSAFLFIVQIVLLNMLIALMRDIYNSVRSTQEDVFLRGRAQLIVEVETLMRKTQLEAYSFMPPYVHLLSPVVKRDVLDKHDLDGRMDALHVMLSKQAEMLNAIVAGGGGGGAGFSAYGATLHGHSSGGAGYGGGPHAGDGAGHAGFSEYGLTAAHAPPSASSAAATAAAPGTSTAAVNAAISEAVAGLTGPDGTPLNVMGMSPAEQIALIQVHAMRSLKDSESQLPAVLRQIDRLQRTVNTQEMRLEGVVTVLRDIENLLRNQQPVIIHQETRPPPRKGSILTEAELELEVKRLLGKNEERL